MKPEAKIMEAFDILLEEMMKSKGITEYEINMERNSSVGDGYMGEIVFFKILSKKNGQLYHLMMKLANKSEKLRKSTTLERNFEREVYMYTTVFNSLKSFLIRKNIIDIDLRYIPELFWYSSEHMKEALVLENLKEAGFAMWKRKEGLDFEHTMMVVKILARWHGTVMAFRDQRSEEFESWIPHLRDIRYQVITQMGFLSFTTKYYKKIIQMLENRGYHELAKKYKQLEGELDKIFSPVEDMSDRLVITHADCWINNIMFKFDGEKKTATDCKLFDFQFSQLNTPVEDLSFFIYTASDESVLDDLNNILRNYYSVLSSTISSLGSNPESIFTFDHLCRHWKKYGIFGVINAIEIYKLKYFHDDEVPNFLELTESESQGIGEAFEKPIRNEELYMEDVLKVFCKFGKEYL